MLILIVSGWLCLCCLGCVGSWISVFAGLSRVHSTYSSIGWIARCDPFKPFRVYPCGYVAANTFSLVLMRYLWRCCARLRDSFIELKPSQKEDYHFLFLSAMRWTPGGDFHNSTAVEGRRSSSLIMLISVRVLILRLTTAISFHELEVWKLWSRRGRTVSSW